MKSKIFKRLVSLSLLMTVTFAFNQGKVNASTFLTPSDIADSLEIKNYDGNVLLKDTGDSRLVTMYNMGMIQIINNCAEPDRCLTNGEILYMLASYNDYIKGTSYTLNGYNTFSYPIERNIVKNDLNKIIGSMN